MKACKDYTMAKLFLSDNGLMPRWVFLCFSCSFYSLKMPWWPLISSVFNLNPWIVQFDLSHSNGFWRQFCYTCIEAVWDHLMYLGVLWSVRGDNWDIYLAKLRDLWKKQRKGKVWREKVVWSALIGGCGLLCRWQEVVERVGCELG